MTTVLATLAVLALVGPRAHSPWRPAGWLPHRSGDVAAETHGHVAELVALAVSAGLPFTAALDYAAAEFEPARRDDVHRLARALRSGALSEVLEHHEGELRRLAVTVSRAQVTGAPILPAIDALIDEEIAALRATRLAAAQRLPIKLALPLALLILPGFVLLIAAPALMATMDRIGF